MLWVAAESKQVGLSLASHLLACVPFAPPSTLPVGATGDASVAIVVRGGALMTLLPPTEEPDEAIRAAPLAIAPKGKGKGSAKEAAQKAAAVAAAAEAAAAILKARAGEKEGGHAGAFVATSQLRDLQKRETSIDALGVSSRQIRTQSNSNPHPSEATQAGASTPACFGRLTVAAPLCQRLRPGEGMGVMLPTPLCDHPLCEG